MGNRGLIDLYNDEIGGARDPLQGIDGGERRYNHEEITIGIPAKAIQSLER
jgi:hypothetical protein